jgi:hypothetical protein
MLPFGGLVWRLVPNPMYSCCTCNFSPMVPRVGRMDDYDPMPPKVLHRIGWYEGLEHHLPNLPTYLHWGVGG